ncbi:hypothetical protein [Amycolatopsis sp. NPDC054798]
MIGVLADQQWDLLESGGNPANLVEAFANPLPLRIVSVALGIPREAEAEFRRVNNIRLNLTSGIEDQVTAASQTRIATMITLGAPRPGNADPRACR